MNYAPRTELLGPPPRRDDSEILRALVRAAIPSELPKTPFYVGIRNEGGSVYRAVRLYGLTEKARFASLLDALGFEQQTAIGGLPLEGFDQVYAHPGA